MTTARCDTNRTFELQNANFSAEVQRLSKASGVCLLLFDRDNPSTHVSFLHNLGIPQSLADNYVNQIYRHDPLLPHLNNGYPPFENMTQSRYERVGTQHISDHSAEQYWAYLGQVGFHETAASVQAMSSNIFLVVGLLNASAKHAICVDKAMNSMERWLRTSSDCMIEQAVRHNYGQAPSASDSQLIRLDSLTNRETEVVQELIKGKSNKQISAQLGLSEYTVENHLRRIYKKFDVHNRTSLLAIIHATSH